MSEPFRNERVLTPTGLGFDLWTRPALCDETVIDEVITRDGYGLRDRRVVNVEGRTAIDCGAHIGVFSSLCGFEGARRIIAVEPQPENLELLRLNVERFPQVVVVPAAVGTEVGTTYIMGESGGAHTDPLGFAGDEIEVAQVTLSVLIENNAIALLKLDMEGGEVDAVLACPHSALALVDRIVMETHGPKICPWVEHPRVGEVVEHLLYTHNVEAEGFPTHLGKLFATRNGATSGWPT